MLVYKTETQLNNICSASFKHTHAGVGRINHPNTIRATIYNLGDIDLSESPLLEHLKNEIVILYHHLEFYCY